MIKTFTQTDLIRYFYRETTEEEKKEIDKALICDSELMALYNELCAILKEMDESQLEPSSATILNILSYSRSTQPQKRS
ncbi:MAG: hypothetical protein ACOYXT_07110 [Bacteroidota bacterium]